MRFGPWAGPFTCPNSFNSHGYTKDRSLYSITRPVWKQRHRGWKQLVQGHTSAEWQNQDARPALANFGAHNPSDYTILASLATRGTIVEARKPILILLTSVLNPSHLLCSHLHASSTFWEAESSGNGKTWRKNIVHSQQKHPLVSVLRQASVTRKITSYLHVSQRLLLYFFFTEEIKIHTPFHVCSRVKHLLDVLKPKTPIWIASVLCPSPCLPPLCLPALSPASLFLYRILSPTSQTPFSSLLAKP